MIHEHKPTKQPEFSNNFGGLKQFIGTVTRDNYIHIRSIVNSVPPPKKQFNGPKKINPSEPLRRCQEWTSDAIQALTDRGILQPYSSGSSSSDSYWKYNDKHQRYYHTREDGNTEWAPEASGSASNSNSNASKSYGSHS